MSKFLVLKSTKYRLEEIHRYTKDTWGDKQAKEYIEGLFNIFQRIADKEVIWRSIPAEFGVNGYVISYEKHYIYWKALSSGQVGIVSILHQRMHQIDRFHDDLDFE